MGPAGLSFGAVAVATTASFILYGGTIYFVSIAMKWRLDLLLQGIGLGAMVRTWRRGFHGQVAVFGVVLLVVLSVEAVAIGPGAGPDGGVPFGGGGRWVEMSDTLTLDGYATEGAAPMNATPELGGVVPTSVNLSLQWVDNDAREPPAGPLDAAPRNRPDTLRLSVKGPGAVSGTVEAANDPSTRLGEVELGPFKAQQGRGLEGIVVTVECLEAGDVTGRFLTYVADGGNDYVLFFEYTYQEWIPGQNATD